MMIETTLFEDARGKITGIERAGGRPDLPLIVAIHGGGCHAGYFDVPGHSLLDRAEAQGHTIIALNRPGYGGSTRLVEGTETLAANADRLTAALKGIWSARRGRSSGIFLIGHSIGAAITTIIAAQPRGWDLVGIAISGVMTVLTPGAAATWSKLPRTGWLEVPAEARDVLAYGSEGSFSPEVAMLAREANARSACGEGYDISFEWPRHFEEYTGEVAVAVCVRQAACDALWLVNEAELERFAKSFRRSPLVDAAIIPQVGHCMDHHHIGPELHDQQLAFARKVVGL
jgi:pimeloyl-ACP methyl ester carboxylesterase